MEKQTYISQSQANTEHYQRREALKTLSQSLKPLRKIMETHLNDIILGHYAHEQGRHPEDFKTYMSWQKEGYRVKRGEKGFAIWSRPKTLKMGEDYKQTSNAERKTTPKDVLGQDEYSYYGMAYLFHIGQVEKIEGGDND
jgi:hypothetical protein